MATIAVGDVHGCLEALIDLLAQLRPELGADDQVVFLGDYIDRGPQSRECIDAILAFRAEVPSEVVCLAGNHEDWLLRSLSDHRAHSWLLGMNGLTTVESYSSEVAQALRAAMSEAGESLYDGRAALPYDLLFDAMPPAHRAFLQTLVPGYKGDGCVCAHAGVDPLVPEFSAQTRRAMLWGAVGFPHHYSGNETVVYGHFSNAVLGPDRWPAPAMSRRTIGIDTIAHGVLTAVRLPDRRVFQSARYS